MKKIVLLFLFFIAISSCSSKKEVAGNYTYKSECMGVELDGSQTIKAWGNGRNRSDAVAQAKKNAVRDIIFFGISQGKSECNSRPLIFEVNAQEKYEDYFNRFFADQGEYKNFISLRDERIFDKVSRDRKDARESVTHGMIVRVLRNDLRSKLVTDGIIKK